MPTLSASDRDLWRGFRRGYEQVGLAIDRELVARAGLSGSDHGILSRLGEAGADGLRQQELADAMRWDRTRLSHHLSRMEQRGLVARTRRDGGTFVAPTAKGEEARRAADPIHDAAVLTHFIGGLSAAQREALRTVAAFTGPAR